MRKYLKDKIRSKIEDLDSNIEKMQEQKQKLADALDSNEEMYVLDELIPFYNEEIDKKLKSIRSDDKIEIKYLEFLNDGESLYDLDTRVSYVVKVNSDTVVNYHGQLRYMKSLVEAIIDNCEKILELYHSKVWSEIEGNKQLLVDAIKPAIEMYEEKGSIIKIDVINNEEVELSARKSVKSLSDRLLRLSDHSSIKFSSYSGPASVVYRKTLTGKFNINEELEKAVSKCELLTEQVDNDSIAIDKLIKAAEAVSNKIDR